MRLKNPCRKCLVRPCCTKICEIKEEFIEDLLKIGDMLFEKIPVSIAFLVLIYTFLTN